MVKDMYYIYEIPGIKIGCTINVKNRQRQQDDKGEMIILEQHEDIMIASQRELELQKEKGYKVDSRPYWKFAGDVEQKKEAARLGGLAVKNRNIWSPIRIARTKEAAKIKITCPHCGKVGSQVAMPRWHFDHCREKP